MAIQFNKVFYGNREPFLFDAGLQFKLCKVCQGDDTYLAAYATDEMRGFAVHLCCRTCQATSPGMD